MKHLIFLCFLLLLVIGCSSNNTPNFQVIPGPETKGVSNEITGTLLFDKPVGGLISLSLPEKVEKVIRIPGESSGTVHSVSGPDQKGRLVIIENHMMDDRHILKVYQNNGNEFFSLFERDGDALWDDVVGDYIALSPVNGLVALVTNVSGFQQKNPGVYLQYGTLEIWDIDSKERLQISVGALDFGLSWFPDGKHLAYVDLLDKKEAEELYKERLPPETIYGQKNLGWNKIPTVSVINVETGKVQHVFIGWRPVVSDDGQQIFMGDYDNNWIIFSPNGSYIKTINPPGIISLGGISFDESRIFYWGLPTEGAELKATKNNSPLVGPKPMYTLKVAELKTGKFETIIPFIDPRRDLSFGSMAKSQVKSTSQ